MKRRHLLALLLLSGCNPLGTDNISKDFRPGLPPAPPPVDPVVPADPNAPALIASTSSFASLSGAQLLGSDPERPLLLQTAGLSCDFDRDDPPEGVTVSGDDPTALAPDPIESSCSGAACVADRLYPGLLKARTEGTP